MEFLIGLIVIAAAVGIFLHLRKKKAAARAESTAAPVVVDAAPAAQAAPTAKPAVAVALNQPSTAKVTIYYDPNCPDWPAQKAEYIKKYPNAVFVPQS